MRMRRKAAIGIMAAALSVSFAFPAAALDVENRVIVDVPLETDQEVLSLMDVICGASGITVTSDGSFLVTDTYNKNVWKVRGKESTVYAGEGGVRDLWGEPVGGYNDGAASESFFKEPWAIAPFLDGYAVSDTANNAVRFLGPDGVQTATGKIRPGFKNGIGTQADFNHPTGLAADEDGSLYIADTNNNMIRKITFYGEVTTYLSGLNEPTGLCYKGGSLYVAESGAHRVLKVTGGVIETVMGDGTEGSRDGAVSQARFSNPQGVAVGDDGAVYVSDTGNHEVRKIQNGTVTTILSCDQTRLEQYPMAPRGLAVLGDKLYVCDTFARKVLVLAK